ncbi:MAG TPA: PIN domain-containing protein [Candidatus Sulfotelmatobacter sp.]|jgi:predicted nucleic acid-binding protein
MTAPVFVDTNVLIYAVDDSHPRKQEAARMWRDELWKSRRGRISFQVLQEFYVNVAHRSPAARQQAQAEVRNLLEWHPVAVNAEVLEQSWKIQERYKLSFWDSLIVAAAKAASCQYLLTEDLQADQDLDGILVVNPFRSDPGKYFLE